MIEELEDRPTEHLPCAIDVAMGSSHCVQHQLFDVRMDKLGGRGPRLSVSRYYWDLEPPVAVDFVRELRFGEAELATKKTYFAERNIRYILAKDAWDGESVEEQLAAYKAAGKDTPVKPKARPLVGPRPTRS